MDKYTGFGNRRRIMTSNPLHTPQMQPIPGSGQTRNNAGGYSWTVNDEQQLKRFLILGSTNSTYYVSQKKLTRDNLATVEKMLREGKGKQVIDTVVEVSEAGRAMSNDPAIFVLARCIACDVHGKVKREIPASRTYALHRKNHQDLFEQHQDGETWQDKKGNKTFTREGETIHMTVRTQARTIEVDHDDDIEIRRYALAALPKVCRTGTHVLHFLSVVKEFRGWGRILRTAVKNWYGDKNAKSLAFQLLKYQQRDGYAQRDGLRQSHPKAKSESHNIAFHWATKGWEGIGEEPHSDPALQIIWAAERAKRATDEKDVAALIREYKLPREAVPTQFLSSLPVWEALLEDMPMEAMVRNLATMTRVGLIAPFSNAISEIEKRLRDQEMIKKARLHPMKLLAALTTYSSGKGVRGNNTWEPNQRIIDALDNAFYLSFDNVQPTGKRLLIAVDTSGSMSMGTIGSMPGMSLHKATGAMALITAKTEPNHHIIGVDTRVQDLPISKNQRLDDVVRILDRLGGGGTNLSLPMEYALEKRWEVDTFIIYTDSETWAGDRYSGHPSEALTRYRQAINPQARVINVQMASTSTSNNDPDDRLALEVVGFDTNVPTLISEFISGEF